MLRKGTDFMKSPTKYLAIRPLAAWLVLLAVIFTPAALNSASAHETNAPHDHDIRLSALSIPKDAAPKLRDDRFYHNHILTKLNRVPTLEQLENNPTVTGDSEWQCLAEALYFEARGEEIPGMFAVAEVIINRRDSSKFPSTICGVIEQGASRRHKCQFSYKCDGLHERFAEKEAYELVGKVAKHALRRSHYLTSGAIYYHANTVNPRWNRTMSRTAEIGRHFFYR